MDGDVGLQAERFLAYVNLFSDQRLARQAELGLRAKPEVRAAVSDGRTAIRTADRIVFVANGRGGVVDEFRLDDVVRVVGRLAVPPPLQPAPAAAMPGAAPADADVLEQLRKLGELRKVGVLTDGEFEAKKAELLGRVGGRELPARVFVTADRHGFDRPQRGLAHFLWVEFPCRYESAEFGCVAGRVLSEVHRRRA